MGKILLRCGAGVDQVFAQLTGYGYGDVAGVGEEAFGCCARGEVGGDLGEEGGPGGEGDAVGGEGGWVGEEEGGGGGGGWFVGWRIGLGGVGERACRVVGWLWGIVSVRRVSV